MSHDLTMPPLTSRPTVIPVRGTPIVKMVLGICQFSQSPASLSHLQTQQRTWSSGGWSMPAPSWNSVESDESICCHSCDRVGVRILGRCGSAFFGSNNTSLEMTIVCTFSHNFNQKENKQNLILLSTTLLCWLWIGLVSSSVTKIVSLQMNWDNYSPRRTSHVEK